MLKNNPQIVIYTKDSCPYCVKAKSLLKMKNAAFQEIKVTNDDILQEMIKKSLGRKTVPQIFINDQSIGGCDDLHALNDQGKLDQLLK
jgi:glutaredoxin 3